LRFDNREAALLRFRGSEGDAAVAAVEAGDPVAQPGQRQRVAPDAATDIERDPGAVTEQIAGGGQHLGLRLQPIGPALLRLPAAIPFGDRGGEWMLHGSAPSGSRRSVSVLPETLSHAT
jgi:hypothetical protein